MKCFKKHYFFLWLGSHTILSTHLIHNKLSSVITIIATVEWPEKWPELFSTLQATPCYNSTVIALISLRDLINICYNLSTSPIDICLERQRIIAKNLEVIRRISKINLFIFHIPSRKAFPK
jgi:hypothetical protein